MEAEGAERPVEVADGVFEAGHGGLKIEDILGRHAGDRSTADVLDPLGACPQPVPQGGDEGRGAGGPVAGVVHDHRVLGIRSLDGGRVRGVHSPTVTQRRVGRDRRECRDPPW